METTKKPSNKFSHEIRARTVRMAQERQGDHASQWATIASIAAKVGCSGETLRNWVRQAERDAGVRPGATTDERVRFKLMPGQRHDTVGVAPLIEGLSFDALIADKAFDSNVIIASLDERGAKAIISRHPRRSRPPAFDEGIYK